MSDIERLRRLFFARLMKVGKGRKQLVTAKEAVQCFDAAVVDFIRVRAFIGKSGQENDREPGTKLDAHTRDTADAGT